MIEYEMMGHRIPNRVVLKNMDWFKEGCLTEIPPKYTRTITLEELERILDEGVNDENK